MDKEQAIKLAQRYKAAVAERLPIKALYLYGSYSKGNHTEVAHTAKATIQKTATLTLLLW